MIVIIENVEETRVLHIHHILVVPTTIVENSLNSTRYLHQSREQMPQPGRLQIPDKKKLIIRSGALLQ
jgi:hypothetical protein